MKIHSFEGSRGTLPSAADAPLMRTTPMPPRPAGVAMATIVSSVEYICQLVAGSKAFYRLPATG